MKEVATKHGNLRAENSRKGYTSSDAAEKEFVSAGRTHKMKKRPWARPLVEVCLGLD
jgi:hypothetical protein